MDLSLIDAAVNRVTWSRILVIVACLIYWAEDIRRLGRLLASKIPLGRSDPPMRALDDVVTDLASSDFQRIVSASRILRGEPAPVAVPYLTALLDHPDLAVAIRAACLLYERQDPEAFPLLYRFMARRTAGTDASPASPVAPAVLA